MNTDELNFIQWEQEVFGSGYGTGEEPILRTLKKFFSLLDNDSYHFGTLEKELGDDVTWLLINSLSKGDVIEWGTSSRFGWLTTKGKHVRDFCKKKTVEELYEIVMSDHQSICFCNGEIKEIGHEYCGKNPMLYKD